MTIRIYQQEDRLNDTFHDRRYVEKLVKYLLSQGFTVQEAIGKVSPSYHLKKKIDYPKPSQ